MTVAKVAQAWPAGGSEWLFMGLKTQLEIARTAAGQADARPAQKPGAAQPRVNRTDAHPARRISCVSPRLRNENVRLPYFLDYYRQMGVAHFLMVDNGSDDGSAEYLEAQRDVSLWTTGGSYKASCFGVDWLNHLQWRYGADHWCLVADVDEFLLYPYADTRPLHALTDWLDSQGRKSFSAMLLDMYPKGPVAAQPYSAGQNPFEIARWFDAANYSIKKNPHMGNLWIQGGVRQRLFMADSPEQAPALNKVPLVRWSRKYAYVSSSHMALPRGLNRVYDESRGRAGVGGAVARQVPGHDHGQGGRGIATRRTLCRQPRIPRL